MPVTLPFPSSPLVLILSLPLCVLYTILSELSENSFCIDRDKRVPPHRQPTLLRGCTRAVLFLQEMLECKVSNSHTGGSRPGR